MIGEEIFIKLKNRFKGTGKFRILFCPYKEDMFDCMETIFESAKKDDDTITEIMPIPYFKLERQLPKELAMEFPNYCGNFPEALNDGWDCIIVHNQYDQYNSVTRLLLTSLMLKQFCNNLVFIGYAVIGDRDIDREEIHLPAFKNFDLVICETEKQAEQTERYIREFGWSGKAVGWGNPKYDKLDKEIFIPMPWRDKIEGKEIILLQTSLVPFMQHPAEKFEQITETIKKYFNDDKVCLWWRPHPLLEHTIKTQFTPIFDDYEMLVSMVRGSRHIYDDTRDCHRAIIASDRMISDKSSMVIMYRKTGKPIEMLEEL